MTIYKLYLSRTPQVFTPQVCAVLAEANQIIRALRATGARPLRLTLEGVQRGQPAELMINGVQSPRIDSALVHVTRQL